MRWFLAILLALAVVPAYAANELSVGVEYTNLEKKVPDAYPITIAIPGYSVSAWGDIGDIDVSTVLANFGYKISENLIPYALIGSGSAEMEWQMKGALTTPKGGISTTIFRHVFENDGFAYGFGVRGKVLTIEDGLDINYDIRRLQMDLEDDMSTRVLGVLRAPTHDDIDYGEWNATITASKDINFSEDALIKKVTPYVGYRFTSVDMDIQHQINALDGFLKTTLAYSLEGNLHSVVLGASAKLNDNWSAFVDGVILKEEGIRSGVTYNF